MKQIIAIALTICLFACKQKEETTVIPGLVGTFELSSTKTAYVFQDLLPEYDNFQEKTIAIITPQGNSYRLQIQTTGIARKAKDTPVNYGFSADMNCSGGGYGTIGLLYTCQGKYSNLTPSNPVLDKRSKEINAIIISSGLNLEITANIPYQEDLYPIVKSTLLKIK